MILLPPDGLSGVNARNLLLAQAALSWSPVFEEVGVADEEGADAVTLLPK